MPKDDEAPNKSGRVGDLSGKDVTDHTSDSDPTGQPEWPSQLDVDAAEACQPLAPDASRPLDTSRPDS